MVGAVRLLFTLLLVGLGGAIFFAGYRWRAHHKQFDLPKLWEISFGQRWDRRPIKLGEMLKKFLPYWTMLIGAWLIIAGVWASILRSPH